MTARATDSDGSVSFVDFFANTTNRLGRVFSPSSTNIFYNFRWSNAPSGTFQLHAEAVDDVGGRAVSQSVQITVVSNVPPVVTWEGPPNGSSFFAGDRIFLQAGADDSDGSVSFVDFFVNTNNILGRVFFSSTNNGLYTLIWSNVPSGTFQLHAEAVDDAGGRAVSQSVQITVVSNMPPVVTWIRPTNGSTFAASSNIVMQARATDSDGFVPFVEFFANSNRLGRAFRSDPPSELYTFVWTNAPPGTFRLHAEGVDDAGGRGVSQSVQITVQPPTTNMSPAVTWLGPTNGSRFGGSDDIIMSARATDSDGSVSFVDFFANNSRLRRVFSSSSTNDVYVFRWSNPPSGTFQLHAEAVDNAGGGGVSQSVQITISNAQPVVTLTQPTNGAVFLSGRPIFLSAEASDPDGSVRSVDFLAITNFFVGTNRFFRTNRLGTTFFFGGTPTTFNNVWSNAPPGDYMLRAAALDNRGAFTFSAPVSITVLSNRPPTATAQSATLAEDSTTAITLTGTDPDEDFLTFTIVTPPTYGSLSGFPPDVSYTPNPNYFGPDSFTFTVGDRQFTSAPATVDITVTPVNDAPVAGIDVENAVTFLERSTIIALDAASGTVVLDASQSSDVDNDPLEYLWSVGDPSIAFAAGVRATSEFPSGSYVFQLEVSDGELVGVASAEVDVLTPCDAIDLLIQRIEASSHEDRVKRPLIGNLRESCEEFDKFDKGKVDKGIEGLQAFQGKVETELGEIDPALAELLINAAQTLIDAIPIE